MTATGSGTLYHQWRRNTGKGLWLNREHSETLQSETAKPEMNKWQYRLAVTGDTGSTVSDAVTLSAGDTPISGINVQSYPATA